MESACEHGNEPLDFIKGGDSRLVEQLLPSQN
jgi:hypothetical protein